MYYHQIVAKLPNLSVLAIGRHLRTIMYVYSRFKTHVQESEHYRILLRPLQETTSTLTLSIHLQGEGQEASRLGFSFFLFNTFADKHTILPCNFTTKLSVNYKIFPQSIK